MSRTHASVNAVKAPDRAITQRHTNPSTSIQAKESATDSAILLNRSAHLGHNFEQAKFASKQDHSGREAELLGTPVATIQAKGGIARNRQILSAGQSSRQTGLPDNLQSRVEALSGVDLDNVRVHYNSSKPSQLGALAYAQDKDIHIGPGQEQHLPHEAWHVVQQAQGRVKPTRQMKGGVHANEDLSLEREADVMGAKANAVRATGGESQPYARAQTTGKGLSLNDEKHKEGGGASHHISLHGQNMRRRG